MHKKATAPKEFAASGPARSSDFGEAPLSRRSADIAEAARTATFEACAKARAPESQRVPSQGLPDECDRVRLIGDLTRLAQEPLVPDDQRRGCLELIGWLARRMAHELPHAIGCGAARDCDPEGDALEEASPPSRRSPRTSRDDATHTRTRDDATHTRTSRKD